MNKDEFQGKFRELKNQLKEKWGKLSDDEITQINGNLDQLLTKLQQIYGLNKERAEEEIKTFLTNAKCASGSCGTPSSSKSGTPSGKQSKEKIKR